MAAAGVKRWGWPAAAVLAAGLLAALALHGERPEAGLARFAPAGIIADWPVQRVNFVEIGSGTARRTFRRDPAGAWQADGNAAAPGDLIEAGLTLLHNAAPQRTDLSPDQLAEFGLAPPRLVVTARTAAGDSRAIAFGGANPLGLERYARIAGRDEVLLLPSFVAEAWERIAR